MFAASRRNHSFEENVFREFTLVLSLYTKNSQIISIEVGLGFALYT